MIMMFPSLVLFALFATPVVAPVAPPSGDPPQVVEAAPGTCSYPVAPYRFSAANDVVGPMVWPTAMAGKTETLPADLNVLHCDASVRGVYVMVTATWCASCAERLQDIGRGRDHWQANGIKFIFIVQDALSPAQASAYIDRYNIDFGWRTNDADNSLGASTIVTSPIFSAIPWTGVIRTSDMVLMYDESEFEFLDLRRVAVELAP
jgi:hypothetical protein